MTSAHCFRGRSWRDACWLTYGHSRCNRSAVCFAAVKPGIRAGQAGRQGLGQSLPADGNAVDARSACCGDRGLDLFDAAAPAGHRTDVAGRFSFGRTLERIAPLTDVARRTHCLGRAVEVCRLRIPCADRTGGHVARGLPAIGIDALGHIGQQEDRLRALEGVDFRQLNLPLQSGQAEQAECENYDRYQHFEQRKTEMWRATALSPGHEHDEVCTSGRPLSPTQRYFWVDEDPEFDVTLNAGVLPPCTRPEL